jgi:dCTP diphosphatase
MNEPNSLASIEESVAQFARDRDWDQFHTPKNLILAAIAEMGELAEVLQWKSDEEVTSFLKSDEGKTKLSEEIADVVIYLIRLCQKSEISLVNAINDKLLVNAKKYPIDLSRGNAKKYSER